jgi:alpha-glucosidase
MRIRFLASLLIGTLGLAFGALAASEFPSVGAPPESFFEIVSERDREAARAFYRKYIDLEGMPVVAAESVSDQALQRTYGIVFHLLAGRPDILAKMVENRMYLIIIGKDQFYTDMPEYRNTRNPDYMNERVRGTGGRPTSFGEENVLGLPIDRYDDESIGVHEFCHTIDGALRSLEPDWNARRNLAYKRAMDKGLWKFSYAASNPGEFWAEACQSYFDCNRVNNWNHGPIGTREQLKAYDPETYEFVRAVFRLTPETDWRYSFPQKHPVVVPPPARFKIDPYYTKFSWAREFPVIGHGASDRALLKANDTIRKMFAYRHDILKALITDDVKLVVLGKDEHLSDLPEYAAMKTINGFDPVLRMLEYNPETKLVVVGEENILSDPAEPMVGDPQVIRLFAKAVHAVTAHRPVDPDWDRRGRDVQQYELRVKRLDETFGRKLAALHTAATAAGKWKGTAAMNGPADYFAEGVVAFFDAGGQKHPPEDAAHPVVTRDQLAAYDPELFALVRETLAYDGHVDWRFRADRP